MKKIFSFAFLLLFVGIGCLQYSSAQRIPLAGAGKGTFGGCSEATTFIARLTSPDATHVTAYTNYVCGLVTAGLWTKFDILYVFAAQNSATSLINLPNSTYSATNSGGTFTADIGWKDDGSTVSNVNLGFNASTAGSPKYVQNSAHLSLWNLTNTSSSFGAMGAGAGNFGQNIYPKDTGNNIYTRINDNPESGGFAITDPRGHIFGNRSGATAREAYQNGVTLGTYGSVSSQASINSNMIALAASFNSGPFELAMVSAGSSFSSTEVTNFYNLSRSYMTAVGVP